MNSTTFSNTNLKSLSTLPSKSTVKPIDTKKLLYYCWKAVMIVAKIFAGAILFAALASLVPELREKLPYFYGIVDSLLETFNEICKIPFIMISGQWLG